jgi:hypothetical protein
MLTGESFPIPPTIEDPAALTEIEAVLRAAGLLAPEA